MGKRILLNIGLLLIVTLLGVVAWLEPGKTPPAPAQRLTTLQPSAINSIRIQQADTPPIELHRTQDGWRLVAPFTVAANPFRVDGILEIAQAQSLSAFPANEQELPRYGLSPPRLQLELNDQSIAFGDQNSLEQRRYVRLADTIHLIRDNNYYHVAGDATTLVALNPLPPDAEITALQLPKITLHHAEGRWQVEPPDALTPDQINDLLEEWRHAQAIQVERHSGDTMGTDITLSIAGANEPIHFVVVDQPDDLLLVRPDLGLAWRLPAASKETLLRINSGQQSTSP